MILAIDVDNTLLVYAPSGYPGRANVIVSEPVRELIKAVYALDIAKVYLWSGGGPQYAEAMALRYHLDQWITGYKAKGDKSFAPDITLDDQQVTAGKVNLRLPGDITPTPWMITE